MTQWLVDTMIYTGLLIALVLLVRRPVSRHFGPQVAYALWALPLLRMVMPPLVLPAAMAPEDIPAEPAGEAMVIYLSEATANATETAASAPPQIGIALIDLLVPVWLFGAAVFLVWRARDYLAMRRDLLEEARPVGEVGSIRLVETPAVDSPVAFGVSDKVIALPPAFMAHHNIAARDMAIAHELAHHRGYDLVANIAAQPLLALHWFNPLAWWGWRAMRRDQEAACDARVVAGRHRSERAAYAEVIAGFAAGPNLALAAPMACPVLGEKSIIHRLRSLTMSDVSSGRKKLGIAAIATTALIALPVTASITYAQEEAPAAPAAPRVQAPGVPAPPAPPSPPAIPRTPGVPDAPLAPVPPSIESIDPDSPHRVMRLQVSDNGPAGESRTRRFVLEGERELREFIDEEEMERMFADLEAEMEELESINEEVELAFLEARNAREHAEMARLEAMERRLHSVPEYEANCEGSDIIRHRTSADGRSVMVICQSAANNTAAMAMRQAMQALEADRSLSSEQRENIIMQLESAIEQLEARKLSAISASKARMSSAARRFEAKAQVPAPPAVPQPPRVIRTTSVRFQAWDAAAPVAEADACEDKEEEVRFTT